MTMVDWLFEHPYLGVLCFVLICFAVGDFKPFSGLIINRPVYYSTNKEEGDNDGK